MSDRDLKLENYQAILKMATAGLMAAREQRRMIALAVSRAKSRTWLLAVTLYTAFIIAYVLVTELVDSLAHADTIAIAICIGLVFLTTTILLRKRSGIARRELSRALRRKGVRPSLCLRCLYDLKGSVAPKCSECGEPLAPPTTDHNDPQP